MYVIVIKKLNGDEQVYVGSGTLTNGIGTRLCGDYERWTKLYWKKGLRYFSAEGRMIESAASPDTLEAQCRILASFDNCGDDPEQRRIVAFVEALFVDYMLSLGPVSGRENIRLGDGYNIEVSSIMDAYNAVKPNYRVT